MDERGQSAPPDRHNRRVAMSSFPLKSSRQECRKTVSTNMFQ